MSAETTRFDLPFCFVPDGRVTFFCFAKRRVTKEKATHLTAPFAKGANGVPCAAQPAGRLRNSVAMRLRPQTVLADIPQPASAARRLRWGPRSKSEAAADGPQVLPPEGGGRAATLLTLLLTYPHETRRATQEQTEKGRGLSEGGGFIPDRVPQPPSASSSAGDPFASFANGRGTWVAFSFGYFSFGEAKEKYARPSGAKPQLKPNLLAQSTHHDLNRRPTSADSQTSKE